MLLPSMMMLTLLVASKGVAAVPRASLVVLAVDLRAVRTQGRVDQQPSSASMR